MESMDSSMSSELTNHLFEEVGVPHSGMDLAALNIKRGRDHGLSGYTRYARLCRKVVTEGNEDEEIDSFDQLEDFMDAESVERLKKVYR
jgi:peroxidase